MNLNDLKKFQHEFNQKYFGASDRFSKERLLYFALCLCGEVGEFANFVKKYAREKKYGKRAKDDEGSGDFLKLAREELIDVFVYLLILALILDMDIEKEYFKKMKKNAKRFAHFRK